jgi:integrase
MAKDKKGKERAARSTFYYEGKQYEATGKDPKEAAQKAALKLDKLKRGEIGISENMTVRRWADEWLEVYKKPVLGKKQYEDYKGMIDNIIVPEIGALRLVQVKDIHLQKIINSKAGYSRDRIGKLKTRICAMFRQAHASRLVLHNPAEYLTLPKAEDGTHRSITKFERDHFLKVAETHYAGLMFKTMLYCGLRTGEVVALEWRDIDFDKKRIKVSRALESGTDEAKSPKTAAGVREVPIPSHFIEELKAQRGDPFSPVFERPNKKGRYTNVSRSRAWNSLKEAIDVSMGAKFEKVKGESGRYHKEKVLSVVAPDFVPYCLRHTYCTDLQDKGVPINIAKYLMGHANISVTAKIYTHISETAIDTAASLIDGENSVDDGKEDGKAKSEA